MAGEARAFITQDDLRRIREVRESAFGRARTPAKKTKNKTAAVDSIPDDVAAGKSQVIKDLLSGNVKWYLVEVEPE